MYKKKNFLSLIFFALLFFLLLVFLTPVSSFIRNYFFHKTSSLQESMKKSGSSFFKNIEVFQNTKKIGEEIEFLRKENLRMSSFLTSLEEVEKENDALREVLKIEKEDDDFFVFCSVIGKDLIEKEIIIRPNKTIEVDDFAITPEGVLVGVVSLVEKDFAKITTLENKKSSIEVKVNNEDFPIGVLKGTGEKTLFLDLLPKEKIIRRGDRVSTVSQNNKDVEGIFVGRILEVKNNDVDPFIQATVSQGMDYRYLDHLFVIRK